MKGKPEHSQYGWRSIALVMMLVCASVLSTAYALGSEDSGNSIPVVIESGSGVETASYIIYKDGDYCCAKNGTTGRIEYRLQNASAVIQSIVGALSETKGMIFIKEGVYEINTNITIMADGLVVRGAGEGTVLKAVAEVCIFVLGNATNNVKDVELSNMKLDGDNIGSKGVFSRNSVNGNIHSMRIVNFLDWGVHMAFNHSLILYDMTIRSCGSNLTNYTGGIKVGSEKTEYDLPAHANLIDKVTIEDCTVGIWIVGSITTVISNSVIEGNWRQGIVLDRADVTANLPSLTKIVSCYFEANNRGLDPGVSDIYFEGLSQKTYIESCNFVSPDMNASIMSGGSADIRWLTLVNNVFTTHADYPINLKSVTTLRLEGNQFSAPIIVDYGKIDGLSINQFSNPNDAFKSLRDGDCLLINHGTWTLSESVVISTGNITILGEGWNSILKAANGLVGSLIVNDGYDDITLRDFAIDGNNGTSGASVAAISFVDTRDSLISGLDVSRTLYGINISGDSGLTKITGCKIITSSPCVFLDDTNAVIVDGNIILGDVPVHVSSSCNRVAVINNWFYYGTGDILDEGNNTILSNNVNTAGVMVP